MDDQIGSGKTCTSQGRDFQSLGDFQKAIEYQETVKNCTRNR